MKYFFLALGLAIASPSIAQQYDNSFDYTVFRNYKDMKVANPAANAVTREKALGQFPGWYITTDKLSGNISDIFGDALIVPGATTVAKAEYCMTSKLNGLTVDKADWTLARSTNASFASFVGYQQSFNNHKVLFSNLSFRFTPDGRLTRVQLQSYGKPSAGTTQMDRTEVLKTKAMTEDLAAMTVKSKDVDADWVWFPVPTSRGYELHAAWGFTVDGKANNGAELQLKGYVDATNGDLLYRTNAIESAVNFKVKANVYKNGTLQASTAEPLQDLAITVGSNTFYTNDTGFVSTSVTTPATVNFSLAGKWITIKDVSSTGTVPSYTVTGLTNGNYTFPNGSPSTIRHTTAYYHMNIVHDFVKSKYPTFTDVDVSMPTIVDYGGTCNAVYAGNEFRFFAGSSGCNPFSEINDVMYHEYGHFFSDKFYRANSSTGLDNRALNEANSDIWAISITRTPILGRNCYVGDTNSTIRRYDMAPKVYPQDIQGEEHADGEIIAGAWWDVSVNTASIDTMTSLFVKAYYEVPDGPNGTEGDVYHHVLIAALLGDDDDGKFSTGTPHIKEIVAAFARHGIYLLADAKLEHKEISSPAANTAIPINATLTLVEPAFFQNLKLFYRNRTVGTWDSVDMTVVGPGSSGGTNYTANIPGQATYDIIDYYFQIYDALSGSTYAFPLGYYPSAATSESTIPYQVAVDVKQYQTYDFETAVGSDWTIGNVFGDAAAKSGRWIQDVPVGSAYQGLVVQPGFDHTSGTGKCLVTGNGLTTSSNYNSADVDSGKTTVLTKMFDLTGFVNPIVEYYRWYSDDRGSNARTDAWVVQMKDSSSVIWKTVDNTYQADYNWRRRTFAVKEYFPGAQYIQMRFIANDALLSSSSNFGQGCVEAAVDDISISDNATQMSVGSVKAVQMKIYPNPANTELNINIPAGLTGTLNLYDITGRVIATQEVNAHTMQYSVATGSLVAGQYIISIQTNQLTETRKVVVSH